MGKKKRRYSQEFVDYALTSPSVKSVSESLIVPEVTLHEWVTKAKQCG